MTLLRILFALAAGLFIWDAPACAHDAFPILITINQSGPDLYSVDQRIPLIVPDGLAPRVRMPPVCKQALPAQSEGVAALYRCAGSIGGQGLRLDFPGTIPAIPIMVRVRWLSGETRMMTLAPGETSARIPDPETAGGVARQYLLLGVNHILQGTDHLLFLVCLLWISGTLRRMLLTISGFTLAHSVTLALSALSVVRVPVPPVEASIALSIVFVAVEIFKGPRDTLTWRHPIAVSSSFGLLHGLGFAAVLSEIGLPQTELVTGLLFFNVGVELGQLLFLAAVIGLYLLVSRIRPIDLASPRLRVASASCVGILASYWLFDRISVFWA